MVTDIKTVEIKFVSLWVQIHDVLLQCMTKSGVVFLAKKVGEIQKLLVEDRECWGAFIRVKVKIDATKPLLRHAMVSIENP